MMAELYGKATGCAGGKGGSMHLIDMDRLVLGSTAVVGTHLPIACGWAMAFRREGRGRVVAVFFGDGATEEGVFHECLNVAALYRLPILFVCENNGYAIHSPLAKRWATDRLAERVATYGIPAERLPDDDVLVLRERAAAAVARARAGDGPSFVECPTYRWLEHVGPGEDFVAGYRHRADAERWRANDQVARIGAMLSPAARAAVEASVEDEIRDAIAFAEASPFPPDEDLHRHVFA
jgi:pyruvate dehydrogenase E1 component alpha subunit